MGKTKRGKPTSSSKAVGRSRGGKGGQNYRGKRITSYKCTIDWSSLPDVLKRPMPCDIFKQKIKNFLTAKYF